MRSTAEARFCVRQSTFKSVCSCLTSRLLKHNVTTSSTPSDKEITPDMPALIVLAVLAGGLGLLLASQATVGVAVVGFGCLLAILARIVQADHHHKVAHPPPPLIRASDRATSPGDLDARPAPSQTDTSRRERLVIGGVVAVGLIAAALQQRAAIDPLATDAAPPAVTMRRVLLSANRDGDGWRINNRTDVGWRRCIAESGVSKASFDEIGAYGAVILRADQFEPPFRETGHGLDIRCETPSR